MLKVARLTRHLRSLSMHSVSTMKTREVRLLLAKLTRRLIQRNACMGTVVDLHRLDFGISKILYTSHQRYIAFLSRGSCQPHQTCVPHFIRKTFSCLHLFYLSEKKKTGQAHSLAQEIRWNATRRSLHSRLYIDLPPRIRDWIQRALVHEEDLQLIATELLERLRKYTRWVLQHFSTAWTELRFFGMISDNRLSAKHHAS